MTLIFLRVELTEARVDSLKVTGMSLGSMGALCMDILPWILGVTVGILQIIYLIKQIRSK
jgi:hypothetical protein